MWWNDGWGMGWGSGWMMLFGGLVPLLFLALLIFLVVQAVGGGRAPSTTSGASLPPQAARHETPLETAQRRYASGELSRDEFVRIRDDLGGTGGAPSSG